MPRPRSFAEQGPRLLLLVLVMFAVWCGSAIASALLLGHEPQSLAGRVTAVLIGVGGLFPWVWVVSIAIRAQDEYKQRIHLVALGVAFGATGVFVMTADLLIRAGFVDYLPLSWIVMWMACAWAMSIAVASRLYR